MHRYVFVLTFVALGTGCSSASTPSSSSPKPAVENLTFTGDKCALHHTAAHCSGDTAESCHWVARTTACPVVTDGGAPCELGSCQGPNALNGGSGTVRADCACPTQTLCTKCPAQELCLEISDQLSCETIGINCSGPDYCSCYSTSSRTCRMDSQVSGMCACY